VAPSLCNRLGMAQRIAHIPCRRRRSPYVSAGGHQRSHRPGRVETFDAPDTATFVDDRNQRRGFDTVGWVERKHFPMKQVSERSDRCTPTRRALIDLRELAGNHALLPQTQCTRLWLRRVPAVLGGDCQQARADQSVPAGWECNDRCARSPASSGSASSHPANGVEAPALIAVIDESRCIGCVKCLPPCPVDAIVGARRQTHTVIADVCTGCELCVAPCQSIA